MASIHVVGGGIVRNKKVNALLFPVKKCTKCCCVSSLPSPSNQKKEIQIYIVREEGGIIKSPNKLLLQCKPNGSFKKQFRKRNNCHLSVMEKAAHCRIMSDEYEKFALFCAGFVPFEVKTKQTKNKIYWMWMREILLRLRTEVCPCYHVVVSKRCDCTEMRRFKRGFCTIA